MEQHKCMVKGVAKYKTKYKTTGFLLDAGNGEFWADMPGEYSWKDYKDKEFMFNLEQNAKGFWQGTIEGHQPQTSGPGPGQSPGPGASPGRQAPAPKTKTVDETGVHIARMNTLDRAVELFKHTHPDQNENNWPVNTVHRFDIEQLAEDFKDFVLNGVPQPQQYQDDIPFP